jgi:tRNA A37 threonylcarbamoyladenosine synthetase subunit TsaC/SUA5/YrdC
VAKELGGDVDLIVDAGECVGKIPSTVVDATGIEPVLLREGLIPFAEILGVVKRKVAY